MNDGVQADWLAASKGSPVRSSIGVALSLGVLLGGVTLSAAGCGSFWGCDADATCKPDDGAGAQSGTTSTGEEIGCPADPLDGTVEASCGIWVSSSLGDDKNPGTQDRPARTLAHAIALANADLKKGGRGYLYACGESYAEVVTLSAGVSLFGGFDCKNGWSHNSDGPRAVIQAPPAVAALTLPASDRESAIVDVDVRASDAMTIGGSSIGVLAQKGARAVFRRTHVWAGNGANGANGIDGGHGDGSAKAGLAGQNGMDACMGEAGLGGLAVVTHCGDGTQPTGGEGGDGNEAGASDGLGGLPQPNPNLQGQGAGGKGQDPIAGTVCTGGTVGAHGNDGAHGFGASGDGVFSNAGVEGVAGGDGENGLPGQGGGGGGASLGSALCGMAPHGGAGGGSGGSGGCGGEGGKGGQAGGSSIGMVTLSADVRAESDVTFEAAHGGNGGNGGPGQLGGQGGLPGYGGVGYGGPDGALKGCAGGVGGSGGDGGDGGGGHGGHSIGVVSVGIDMPRPFVGLQGEAGEGGHGGALNSAAQRGEKGLKASTLNVK